MWFTVQRILLKIVLWTKNGGGKYFQKTKSTKKKLKYEKLCDSLIEKNFDCGNWGKVCSKFQWETDNNVGLLCLEYKTEV